MSGRRVKPSVALLLMVFCLAQASPMREGGPDEGIEREEEGPALKPVGLLPLQGETPAVTFDDLNSHPQDFTLVDIRRRDELVEFGQIPGSHVLPLQELEEALALSEEDFVAKYGFPKLKPEDPTLVLTCRSGRRVKVADKILKERGFTKHRIYYGSFLDWLKNKGNIIKPGIPFQPLIQ